jgi:KDO2-lipid IV(A) lauroyltransferase
MGGHAKTAMPWPKRLATHLALLPLRLLGRLPLRLGRTLVRPLAWPLRLAMAQRRDIARRNLELCFPELDRAARERLLNEHFRQLAEGVAEIAMAWSRPGALDETVGTVTGLEHLAAARKDGRGVVLFTGHTTCLELGARLVGERIEASGIYRPLGNPVLEQFQNRGRARYAQTMIPRSDPRAMVRHLRSGGVLWYAPDQDFGLRRSTFAPFLGVPTATATGILDLARLGRARLVPMYPHKNPDTGRIVVELEAAFAPFPTDDPVADLTRVNAFLERHVRALPAQYWWLHRRFKTRPPGEANPYGR